MQLPDSFKTQIKTYLKEEFASFEQCLQSQSPTSIRFNPLKPIEKKQTMESVSWCSEAFYLPKRPVFTLDPFFYAGAYYVQEASSMFIAEAVRQSVQTNHSIKALDLCAAPGGKSTLLASILPENSFLLCNEVLKGRLGILQQNMHKWGAPNVAISNHDSRDFKGLRGFFDLVLVNAPCSGEGLFRKDPKAIKEWSPEKVQICSARQERILEESIPLVKEGGVLLYSTCTYNSFENETRAKFLLEHPDFEAINLEIPAQWKIEERSIGYQFYPHRLKGEGFYLACFRKKRQQTSLRSSILRVTNFSMKKLPKKLLPLVQIYLEQGERFQFYIKPNQQIVAIPSNQVDICMQIDQVLQRKGFGIEMGQFKGEQFAPSHQLALSAAISTSLPAVELSKEEALLFLKKESFPLENVAEGWTLASYEGLNLGWMKVHKNRINNYFPKEWRIQMRLD